MLRGYTRFALVAAILLGAMGLVHADSHPDGLVTHVGTEVEPFEGDVLSNWQVIGTATPFLDSVNIVEGSQSIGLQGTAGYYQGIRTFRTLNLADNSTFSFWIHIDTPTAPENGPSVALYFTNDGYQSYFTASSNQLHQGWNMIVFSRLDFAATNNPSWDVPMNSMQFRINPAPGSVTGVRAEIDDFDMAETTRPKVVISFDDCWSSDFLMAYEQMTTLGLKGTVYAVSSFVDSNSDRLTTQQLDRLYLSGWDVCNHSATHPHMANMSEADILNEYTTCQNWLLAHGYTRNFCYQHVAYPFGEFSANVMAAMDQLGVLTARTTMVSRQSNSFDEPHMLYAILPSKPQKFADIKVYIDQTIAAGGCLQLCFHRLTKGPVLSTDWSLAEFRKTMQYLGDRVAAGDIDSCTISQWYKLVGRYNRP